MFRRLSLVGVLGIALAAGACLASTMRVEQTLSTSFADLAAIKTLEVTTQSGEVLLSGTFTDAPASNGKVERTAALSSPSNAVSKGTASIEIDRSSGLSEEEVVVKLEALPYPESCRLMADGRELTLFSTTENGKVEFRLTRRVGVSNGKGG
jgi:hypothetical protein